MNYLTKEALFELPSESRDAALAALPMRKTAMLELELEEEAADDSEAPYVATFTVTDSGVDREGDVILSAGMDVDSYAARGSLLWGHRADRPENVLGKPVEIIRGDNDIKIKFQFATEAENPVGAMVGRMVKAGLVSGASVGILVREYSEATDRGGFMPLNITRSELMEVSVTPIPANPRALVVAEAEHAEPVVEQAPETKSVVAAHDPIVAAFVNAAKARKE